MKRKETTITVDEWLKELERLGREAKDDGGALTVFEIETQMGRSDKWIRRRLKIGIADGCIEVIRKTIRSIDGRMVSVAAYRVKR